MSISDRADAIRDEFAFLDDWETRYAHVIDLGKTNPPLEPEERREDTRVRGCASQVWMVTEHDEDDAIHLRAESDALIVSGLIALLMRLYSGTKAREAAEFDTEALFDDIGVTGALSAQRSNGLASMLQRIRADAARTRSRA
jgi:cysteine desulfuration protein SufE